MKSKGIWIAFIVVAGLFIKLPSLYGQHCSGLAMTYLDLFNYKNLDKKAQDLIDTLLIKYYEGLPEHFERSDEILEKLNRNVYLKLPDSIRQVLSFNKLNFNLLAIRDYYTIEDNGFSVAYNDAVENFTLSYYLEGMSPEGMEIFVYQYVDHMPTLFQLENGGTGYVSPIKLKQMVLDEYKQYLSEADLMVIASGWDRKIKDFIRSQRQRDSAYAVSLQIIIPKIDSLKAIYLNSLKSMCGSMLEILNPEEQTYWKETTNKYLDKIDAIARDEIQKMKEYDDEFRPNVIRYHEYFYDLKKEFPSSNFWSWRKGPILNVSTTLLESNSEYLEFYTQFENGLIEIIDKYAANFGFPNYYFSGSQTYSTDKIKKIQVANAVMFYEIVYSQK